MSMQVPLAVNQLEIISEYNFGTRLSVSVPDFPWWHAIYLYKILPSMVQLASITVGSSKISKLISPVRIRIQFPLETLMIFNVRLTVCNFSCRQQWLSSQEYFWDTWLIQWKTGKPNTNILDLHLLLTTSSISSHYDRDCRYYYVLPTDIAPSILFDIVRIPSIPHVAEVYYDSTWWIMDMLWKGAMLRAS